MNLIELATVLKATGYPVAYSHFKRKIVPPFIVYKESFTENFTADNKVFKKIPNIDIELYTKEKDLKVESKLEAILDDNDIPWDVVETYIESEEIYQRIYEIKLT